MKRHYSYFIIKPDGMRFFDKICDTIEQKYKSIRYYALEDYKDIIKKLYYKHYEKEGEKFGKAFGSYLYGLTELFGNQAILAVISDDTREYDELTQNIYDTKLEIRKTYGNNNVGIVTNYDCGKKNYVKIVSEDGKEENLRIMKTLGSHRISDLNIIHSPDPNREDTLRELKILSDEGIIEDRNLVPRELLALMKKYRTVRFQDDMRVPEYKEEIKPDLSGFVRKEIRENYDEEIGL